jgi:hypothetical protein
MQAFNIDTWEKFEEELHNVNMSGAEGPALFRGHASAYWSLDTTLERNGRKNMLFSDYYRIIDRVHSKVQTFTQRSWEVRPYPEIVTLTQEYDEFSRDLTYGRFPSYIYTAYLRHHGFPSCLVYADQEWRYAPHESVFARNDPKQDLLYKFVLPSSEREKVLKRLNAYNLNAYSLFESEESLMETLAFRELESA